MFTWLLNHDCHLLLGVAVLPDGKNDWLRARADAVGDQDVHLEQSGDAARGGPDVKQRSRLAADGRQGSRRKEEIGGIVALQDVETGVLEQVAPPPKRTLPSGTGCCNTPPPVEKSVAARRPFLTKH